MNTAKTNGEQCHNKITCTVVAIDGDEGDDLTVAMTIVHYGHLSIGEASWLWDSRADAWSFSDDGWADAELEQWLDENRDVATPDDICVAANYAIACELAVVHE